MDPHFAQVFDAWWAFVQLQNSLFNSMVTSLSDTVNALEAGNVYLAGIYECCGFQYDELLRHGSTLRDIEENEDTIIGKLDEIITLLGG